SGERMTHTPDNAARLDLGRAKAEVKKATSFWTKINEDWALNFSGMLAYNYLTAIAPILLALLAIAGLALGALSPATYHTFVQELSSHFPAGLGQTFVNSALTALQKSAGVLLIIAIVAAIFSGSRLFVALDNVFAVIYRVDVRPLIQQNVMAILMMLLFLALAPLAFFASSILGTLFGFVVPSGIQSNGLIAAIEGFVCGLIVAFLLFAAIYFVVPNRKLTWATTWPGALVTAFLLNVFELLFPIYQRIFLQGAKLSSVAGLVVVILIFLYYIGVITLVGAEINSWVAGLRPLGATLPQLFRQERREGVGNAPGAPRTGVSRTQPPARAAAPPDAAPGGDTRQPAT
ncbi:MAG TPA: YihY/virulence factor BrkB family protein, partial [Ktedonobacterales bacterium]